MLENQGHNKTYYIWWKVMLNRTSVILGCLFTSLLISISIFLIKEGKSGELTSSGASGRVMVPSVNGSDFNGDGIEDIIIGAPTNDDGGNNVGAAYIFFGATDISGIKDLSGVASPDVTILGKAADDRLGRSVSGLGDVNNDGYDDFIVGSRRNDDGKNNAGAAYIFFGASGLSGTKDLGGAQSADMTILGVKAGDRLGYMVTGAGNINNDAFDDIMIGAPRGDVGAKTNAGYVVIFLGASDLSGTKDLGGGQSPDVTILGAAAGDFLGASVSAGGQINNGNIDDFIIGAPSNDDGAPNAGAVYVFFGKANISGTTINLANDNANVKILGKSANDFLGIAVSGPGDVNSDGFDDIMMGAPDNDDQSVTAGAVYILFGAGNLNNKTFDLGGAESADVTILGESANDFLGRAVSGAGDINNDGIDDFMMGADINLRGDFEGISAGGAYIFLGASGLSGTKALGGGQSADLTLLGKDQNGLVGQAISAAGNVNGDAFDDILVGAYSAGGKKRPKRGKAYIIFGTASPSGTRKLKITDADVTILGKAKRDRLGRSVGGGGTGQ